MKRLAFCFDGTWNQLDSECPTNVVFTAESILPLGRGNTAQLIYYDEGVGTGRWDRIRGGVFGSGLLKNLADAYRFLVFNFTPGDEIYVFGFSRGAYSARSFVGLLNCCGVLLRKHAGRVDEAIDLYQARNSDAAFQNRAFDFRFTCSPQVCVSEQEAAWRAKRSGAPGTPLGVAYLGVWDTVGALGIPASFRWSTLASGKYDFHDTALSPFVRSARHAVAIDERRKDFVPTLWNNVAELNELKGVKSENQDAPYQQQWFPGTHSSVGGGGERRGLSDQALDWVLDGARKMGLELDSDVHSRIYELAPNYAEYLENSEKQSISYRMMKLASADRPPGPGALHEVSLSARRRWKESPENLRDREAYRPGTLARVAPALDSLDPKALGVGQPKEGTTAAEHVLHVVQRGETLGALALRYYGSAQQWSQIYQANLDKIENPDRIYIGQTLRIPKG